MGYQTYFIGSFKLDKPLASEHYDYLIAFNNTRRMKRDANLTITREDPIRVAAGLPVGVDGEYFVSGEGAHGQEWQALDVVDGNNPPQTQPGLWCRWVPNEDGTEIVWDEGEKFYEYTEWIKYLVDNFIIPWGYELNGAVTWSGEDPDDRGTIFVSKNRVAAVSDQIITAQNPFEYELKN